jgi:nucleoside-diphosphate-sugar epimerase
MVRALVTGASGFIGAHLAKTLVERGDEVTCLVRKTSNLKRLDSLPVSVQYGDVTQRESLEQPIAGKDIIYHLAGCIRTLRNGDFYRANVGGTDNVASVCSEQEEPPALVFVSSLAAVAPTKDATPIREDHPPAPISHYGRSKREAELAAEKYADRIPITVVRPGGVFGESDRGCLAMFKPISQIGVHLYPWRLGVSMIHCADLVNLIVLAGEKGNRIDPSKDPARGYYFASADEYPMYDELGRLMAKALGRRFVLTLPVVRPGVWTVATFNEAFGQVIRRPHPFNIDKCREATAGCWFCSIEKAAKELGFSPQASLIDRLRQTADWYRAAGWL